MGLESGNFIDDLDPTWPLGTDFKSQGDDHIRLLKHVLKTQFPNLGDVVVEPTADQINAFPTIAGFADTGFHLPTADPDLDNLVANGRFWLNNAVAVNSPPDMDPTTIGFVTNMNFDGDDATQIIVSLGNAAVDQNKTWIRHEISGSWTSWQLVNDNNGSATLVGEVKLWPTATAPDGHLLCNGASLDTTTYAALFAVLGYDYGGAAASFNLPDYRGQFLRGTDLGAGTDPDAAGRTGGDAVGSTQAGENASHAHAAAGDHGHAAAGSHQHASAGDHGHAANGSHQHPATGDHFHELNRFESGSSGASYVQTDNDDSESPSVLDTKMSTAGDHQHAAAGTHTHANAGAHQHASAGSHSHANAGDHSHAASGGNESRPTNINVNYIIRF